MRWSRRGSASLTALVAFAASAACDSSWHQQLCERGTLSPAQSTAQKVAAQPLQGLPYHPLVYHLDLSVLAYQTYGQSLAWPFDPYYEEFSGAARARFMDRVRAWAAQTGAAQRANDPGVDGFRGPGALGGFPDNASHDPIVYQYSRVRPWTTSVSRPAGDTWVEYLAPKAITGRIGQSWACYRSAGQDAQQVTLAPLSAPPGEDPARTDVFIAFEGATGDKGEAAQPGSQSLMGIVLVRDQPDGYDVHIAFRGSRSGSAERAVKQALSVSMASGNPDWITDLGIGHVAVPEVSTVGEVHRGFARSVRETMPQLMHCLDHVVGRKRAAPPERIWVTGHSLGGALAQHFASVMLLGDGYGPAGSGPQTPASLRAWPWKNLKLISYGAPRVGDQAWARALTVDQLGMDFFADTINPYDPDAFGATHDTVVPRLVDPARPAGYRVLIPTDPITTGKVFGVWPVGKTVYVDDASVCDTARPDVEAHEPYKIREFMATALRDPRVPESAWRYRTMAELNPDRDDSQRGTAAEYRKLAAAARRYHQALRHVLHVQAIDRNLEIFLGLLEEP